MACIKIVLLFCFINICTDLCSAQDSEADVLLYITEKACEPSVPPDSMKGWLGGIVYSLFYAPTARTVSLEKECKKGGFTQGNGKPNLIIKNLASCTLISSESEEKRTRGLKITDFVNDSNKTIDKIAKITDFQLNITNSIKTTHNFKLTGKLSLPFARDEINLNHQSSSQIGGLEEIVEKIPSKVIAMKPHSKFTVVNTLFTVKKKSIYHASIEVELVKERSFNFASVIDGENSSLQLIDVLIVYYEKFIQHKRKSSSGPVYFEDRDMITVVELWKPDSEDFHKTNVVVTIPIEVETEEVEVRTEIAEIPYGGITYNYTSYDV